MKVQGDDDGFCLHLIMMVQGDDDGFILSDYDVAG
jgi:hypothetical protein